MIAGAKQLGQAVEQLGRMQRILESYRNEILTQNPRNFAVLAEARWSNSGNCNSRLAIMSTALKPPELLQAHEAPACLPWN